MTRQGNKRKSIYVGLSPKENKNFLTGRAGGHRKTVFVGLSGGVDSSVSAALLKKAGYDVIGVFIKVWQPDFFECTWKEDRLDAMRICAKLKIPFITLDLEKEYKKEVVDYMIREYKAGRTPNPDVMCNKYIKFGGFFRWALKHGADFVATGHYAQTKNGHLKVSRDINKDQTYFLWTLTKHELAKTLFPVGHLKKSEVRKLAKKFSLPTAAKKDSQGLCFVGKIDMKEFLSHFVKEKEGDVLNEQGVVIGKHPGALFFTIGERHGFTVTAKTPDQEKLYVTEKNISKNTITVSPHKNTAVEKAHTIICTHLNLISHKPNPNRQYYARIRYRQPLSPCTVKFLGKTRAAIIFTEPQVAVTKGQSLVLYDEDECIGGGIIA